MEFFRQEKRVKKAISTIKVLLLSNTRARLGNEDRPRTLLAGQTYDVRADDAIILVEYGLARVVDAEGLVKTGKIITRNN